MSISTRKADGSREFKTRERYENNPEARLRELSAIGVVSGNVAERVPLQPFEPIRSRASLSQAIGEDREDRF